MQEIVILLSSLAGVATGAAIRKIPKEKKQVNLSAGSRIKNQIRTLYIEKDILTKTISRLYHTESDYSKIQKDKLLSKYQHQLGIILAKIEKLEEASKHPDLGPVGDGLITLMDQKLSSLDDKLYEISSKISTVEKKVPEVKQEVRVAEVKQVPKQEKISEIKQKKNVVEVKRVPKQEKNTEVKKINETINFEKQQEESLIIPTRQRESLELTTLTRLSRKEPKFPLFENQLDSKEEITNQRPIVDETKSKIVRETVQSEVKENVNTSQSYTDSSLSKKPDLIKEVAKITEHKALPEPENKSNQKLLDDEFDDDSDDLDKIKGDIMRVLSRLDQAEVE